MQNSYNSPDIQLIGSVESLTAAMGTGSQLDRTFEAGSNFSDLTFS